MKTCPTCGGHWAHRTEYSNVAEIRRDYTCKNGHAWHEHYKREGTRDDGAAVFVRDEITDGPSRWAV